MALNPDRIVGAALAAFDEGGLAGVSMRAVAQRLGVRASALYRHIADKDELVARISRSFYDEALATVTADEWRGWLRQFGHSFHAQLLAHPDSAKLCAIARPVDSEMDARALALAAPLEALGLGRCESLIYQSSVIALTLGWVFYEQSAMREAYLAQLLDPAALYSTSLDAMITGFPGGASDI